MIKSIYSKQYLQLLNWLKLARNDRQLSMRDLALLLEKPHSFIGKVEMGERRLDIYEYVQYCQALGVLPEDGLAILMET